MEKALVSVIVPAYNAGQSIERCLDSLLVQTYKNIELVIVDDGSTDHTSEIVQNYVDRDSRVRLIYQENTGVGEARNTGIREAKGEWVCFVDSDDYVEKEFVEVFINAAIEFQADCVATNFVFEFTGGFNLKYPFKPSKDVMTGYEAVKKTFEILSFPSFVTNKFFRRKIIESNKIEFPPILYEDVFFVNAVFLESERVVFIDESNYHYVMTEGSLTSNFTYKHCQDYLTAINLLRHYIEKKGKWAEWEDLISKYVDRVLFQMLVSLLFLNKDLTMKQRDKIFRLAKSKTEEIKQRPDTNEDPFELSAEITSMMEDRDVDEINKDES